MSGSNPYDEIPYDDLAFPQTHPDRLATTARLFGLMPPPVATCRVLELGCASGGNLLPMAFNLPRAEFVGVDLSRRQIERGDQTIRAVGITNATLKHASILDVSAEWGQFDYIVCHGVFSWVAPEVQEAILRIANHNLSAEGVAYISYNTYPGWHMREMVRHMMRYHAGRFDEPKEQIEQARALLHFLTLASPDAGPYGRLLTREVERLSQASDSYLYHEHLEQTNSPLYFHQFVERAEAAGLQYLAEADVSDMLSSAFPAQVAGTLERISPNILHLEQYMDFVRNRQFRQTLLCHKGLRPKRALSPALMHGLMLSSRAVTDPAPPDLNLMTAVVFRKDSQRAELALPASKAALAILMEEWPRAIDFDELCAAALERALPFLGETPVNDARSAMLADLFKAVTYGMVRLHTEQLPCTSRASETPRAHPLAAYRAQTGSVVVNAHHEMFKLEPFGIEVLRLADGVRSRHEIVDVLVERVNAAAITIETADKNEGLTDAARRAILEQEVDATISSLTRSAVLIG